MHYPEGECFWLQCYLFYLENSCSKETHSCFVHFSLSLSLSRSLSSSLSLSLFLFLFLSLSLSLSPSRSLSLSLSLSFTLSVSFVHHTEGHRQGYINNYY